MTHQKYDEEFGIYYQIVFFDNNDEKQPQESEWMEAKPSEELIENKANELGYDMYELVTRTELIERFNI